jgi:hypothetical protein
VSAATTLIDAARKYAERGFSVVPIDAETRVPLRKGWAGKSLPASALDALISRCSTPGLCLVTGVSGLMCVDIDDPDPDLQRDVVAEFGATPLLVRTPRSGLHAWYGDPAALRPRHHVADPRLDILGGNSLAAVPPSWRPSAEAGYLPLNHASLDDFIRDLEFAPAFDDAALDVFVSTLNRRDGSRLAIKGSRDRLFWPKVRELAFQYDDFAAFVAACTAANLEMCDPPLTGAEIVAKSNWAWKKKQEGKLFRSSEPSRVAEVSAKLYEYRPALVLFDFLTNHHPDGAEVFISGGVISHLKMSQPTLIKAKRKLVELGILVVVHEGGAFEGDVALYRFKKFLIE